MITKPKVPFAISKKPRTFRISPHTGLFSSVRKVRNVSFNPNPLFGLETFSFFTLTSGNKDRIPNIPNPIIPAKSEGIRVPYNLIKHVFTSSRMKEKKPKAKEKKRKKIVPT